MIRVGAPEAPFVRRNVGGRRFHLRLALTRRFLFFGGLLLLLRLRGVLVTVEVTEDLATE